MQVILERSPQRRPAVRRRRCNSAGRVHRKLRASPAVQSALAAPSWPASRSGLGPSTATRRDICMAERDHGGHAGGVALNYGVARNSGRLSVDRPARKSWPLTPGTTFPVELNASPAFRNETQPVLLLRKSSASSSARIGELIQRLAGLPNIHIKAAQAVFTLPLDVFQAALAELESCFEARKRVSVEPLRHARAGAAAVEAAAHRPPRRRRRRNRVPGPAAAGKPDAAVGGRARPSQETGRRTGRGTDVPDRRARAIVVSAGGAGGAPRQGQRPAADRTDHAWQAERRRKKWWRCVPT